VTEPRFDLVVAVDQQLGIGKARGLPWRLPSEMAYFVRTTTDTREPGKRNAVFMGRVNWESIPPKYRPLVGRLNAVLTHRPDYEVPDGVLVGNGVDEMVRRLASQPGVERIFCIGGGDVYAQAIESPLCDQLLLTRVHGSFDCDTFFPPFEHLFTLEQILGEGEDGGVTYQKQRWRRVR
jgi:dihydrofolate reductase